MVDQYTHKTVALAFAITEMTMWFNDTIAVLPPDRPRDSRRSGEVFPDQVFPFREYRKIRSYRYTGVWTW